jgi:cytochrome c peroxidase
MSACGPRCDRYCAATECPLSGAWLQGCIQNDILAAHINRSSIGEGDSHFMGVSNPFLMVRKATGLVGALLVLLSTGGSIFGATTESRHAWQEEYRWPRQIPFPKDDPYTEAKLMLGRMLFFDPILSGSQSRSCASCHNPSLSWTDGQPRAIGEKQEPLPLRTPTLLDVAWTAKLGWDGHFRDLEGVAMGPITSPDNMNLPEKVLIERLSAIPGYVDAFDAAFGEGDITRRKVELALATFERSIVSTKAPFDRWIDGDETAISESAKRGFDLFNGKASCAACHSGWAFTDASFHDIGSAQNDDIGRGKLFPTSVALQYAFKTPTLRDIARRTPYMHDGSVPTLEAVINVYDRGGIDRPSRAAEIHPLGLTQDEKADLITFLHTLDGAPERVFIPELPR